MYSRAMGGHSQLLSVITAGHHIRGDHNSIKDDDEDDDGKSCSSKPPKPNDEGDTSSSSFIGFFSGFCAGVADTFINYIPYGLHLRVQRGESINPFKNPSIYRPRELYRGVSAYSVIIPITCICDGLSQVLIKKYNMTSFSATFISGMVGAALVSAPTSNTIVIQQNHKLSPKDAIKYIIHHYGYRHFTTGISMYLMREGIYSNAVFYAKPKISSLMKEDENHDKSSSSSSLLYSLWLSLKASIIVGVIATIITQPFDTIATCMINEEKPRVKIRDVMKKMYYTLDEKTGKHVGLKRFYLGFYLRLYCVIMGIVVMDGVSNEVKRQLHYTNNRV